MLAAIAERGRGSFRPGQARREQRFPRGEVDFVRRVDYGGRARSSQMRIASLLPSATEIVYSLGLGDALVAVTHECDYPEDAMSRAQVTRNLLRSGLSSARIDLAVRRSRRDVHTVYELDADRLTALAPDVVLTQSLCEVCAVPRAAVESAVCSMPQEAEVVSLDPHSLDEVLDTILEAGEHLNAQREARQLVADLRRRIERVQLAVGPTAERPRVFCCEWLDPIFRAGHWVPEQVRLAGGAEGLGREYEPSSPVEWDEVLQYAPEVIVLMPCGFDASEAAERVGELATRPGWDSLPAVQNGRVFAVNGSAYFSRPGPRLVDGVELLAGILHPDAWARPAPEAGVLQIVARP